MRARAYKHGKKSQRGVALLISIFAMMIIIAMATTLIMMAGTGTAIDANYKSSMQAFYHAKAGLEEGRGRLWLGSPNAFQNFVVPVGSTLAPGQVRYVLNPSAGEVVSPTNLVASNPYADIEYGQEWGVPVTSATVQTIGPAPAVAGMAVPLYKWVRITATTERSTNLDLDNSGAPLNTANPLFYDGAQQFQSNQIPPNKQVWQVFTVTALARTPTGGQRLLQYKVAPIFIDLNLPSALTFDGPSPTYNAPSSNPFMMNGNDRSGTNHTSCPIPAQTAKPSIGVVRNADENGIQNQIPINRQDHYVGAGVTTPSIDNVSTQLSQPLQSVTDLEKLVQTMTSVADQIVQGPATSLPDYGSPTNPLITVVNGDLTLSGNSTGYGILVVTGVFTFSGTTGWRGAVLVIGQGVMIESGGGSNEFDGAVLVAKTRDASGNLLSNLGTPVVDWSGGGGNGVFYDSCWINNATQAAYYRVLSFREISQ